MFYIESDTTMLQPWTVSGTTRMSQYQKGKTNLDLPEQEIVCGSVISWAVCKYLPCPRQNHASIPPLSFLQARCPSCCPTNCIKHLFFWSQVVDKEIMVEVTDFLWLFRVSDLTWLVGLQKGHPPSRV